jgi:hypothetical protein
MILSTFAHRLRGTKPARPAVTKVVGLLLRDELPTHSGAGVRRFAESLTGRLPSGGVSVRQFSEALRGERPVASITPGRERRRLFESCQLDDGKTVNDAKAGVIKDVKILGLESANRRRYTEEAVVAAIGMYEGCKVNLDHPAGNPNASRRVKDRFGKLVNVQFTNGELRGDLRFNPEHKMAGSIRWFAENEPESLGLSHNAIGMGKTDAAGVFVIDKIISVRSVDLVADPATTKSLFA